MRISGRVRGLSQHYADGVERQEIWFEGTARDQLPMKGECARGIGISLPAGIFRGTVRRTPRCNYAWLSAALTDLDGDRVRLCEVLAQSGYEKNANIKLDLEEDPRGFLIAVLLGEPVRAGSSPHSRATARPRQPSSAPRQGRTVPETPASAFGDGRDSDRLEQAVRDLLAAGAPPLGDEYFYAHLPLCVVDAIFSIGIRYATVQNVVQRYGRHHGLALFRPDPTRLPPEQDQQRLGAFVEAWKSLGAESLAGEVFANRCRTSPSNGILKAEAAGRYAEVLSRHGVETLQDAQAAFPDPALERALKKVQGQASGISTDYFMMLAGSDNHLKADRWLCRFVGGTIGRTVEPAECESLLRAVHERVAPTYPDLTLRALDYAIWSIARSS